MTDVRTANDAGHPIPASIDPSKLLLVEDDPAVRRSLQLLLRGRGYNVRAYADGRQMLDDPAAIDAACLITDYRMTSLNGIDLLRDLRARGWQRPAILITGFHGAALASAAHDAGFDVVLEKPLQDQALMTIIQRKAPLD